MGQSPSIGLSKGLYVYIMSLFLPTDVSTHSNLFNINFFNLNYYFYVYLYNILPQLNVLMNWGPVLSCYTCENDFLLLQTSK